MPLLKPHDHTYESLEFKASAAYADYRAALQAVGVACYADVLALFRTERARFDRFHDEWRERMMARVGLGPHLSPVAPPTPRARALTLKRHHTHLRVLDALPADPDAAIRQRDIAARSGISCTRVREALRELEDTGAAAMRTSERQGPGRGQRVIYLYYKAA